MRKLMMLAAILAMMLVASAPAFAHDNETLLLARDDSQVAFNDSSQSMDAVAYQYNRVNISGDGDNEVAQGGVNQEQTQYNANLLFGGFLILLW